jgi:hypothetical protein
MYIIHNDNHKEKDTLDEELSISLVFNAVNTLSNFIVLFEIIKNKK